MAVSDSVAKIGTFTVIELSGGKGFFRPVKRSALITYGISWVIAAFDNRGTISSVIILLASVLVISKAMECV